MSVINTMGWANPKSPENLAKVKRYAAAHYARNKEARKAASKAWARDHRDWVNARHRERTAANPQRRMIRAAKQRAKEKGLEFRLTEQDIVIPETCPVLGIPIVRYSGNRSGGSPTLDRKNNSLGYVPENVAVISHRANRLKADGTLEEILAIARYMGANL